MRFEIDKIIVTKFPGQQGRETWYATFERFLHVGVEDDPAFINLCTQVGDNVPKSRANAFDPVLCDYG
jgi:hypothetical protein